MSTLLYSAAYLLRERETCPRHPRCHRLGEAPTHDPYGAWSTAARGVDATLFDRPRTTFTNRRVLSARAINGAYRGYGGYRPNETTPMRAIVVIGKHGES